MNFRFREKFHPDYLVRKKKDLKQCKIKRLEIYKRIQELGYLDDLGVCHEDQDKLMKGLDAAVILMEGGSAHDLTILDGRDRNSDKPLVAIPVAKLKKDKPASKDEDDSDSEEGNIKDDPGLVVVTIISEKCSRWDEIFTKLIVSTI